MAKVGKGLRFLIILCTVAFLFLADVPGADTHRLHNGWKVTPAGEHIKVGDMILGCAPSPDGNIIAFANVGFSAHMLHLMDARSGRQIQSLPLERAWNGLCWHPDGESIFVSGGASPLVHVFHREGGSFRASRKLALPWLTSDITKEKDKGAAYVAGLSIARDGSQLFGLNLATDEIFALALPGGELRLKKKLEAGSRPVCLRTSPDNSNLYVALWALGQVLVMDMEKLEARRTLRVGSHPNDMLFSKDGRLFVSCGNADAVTVVDVASGKAIEQIRVSLTTRSPAGATPNALALSPDGRSMYVANADNNAVAAIDTSNRNKSQVRGFIPTGWYPTAVAVSPDNQGLIIASGKGLGTRANPPFKLPINPVAPGGYQFIGSMLSGLLSRLEVPDSARLATYTRQVFENTPYRDALLDKPKSAPPGGTNPIPAKVGGKSPIRYVLYIIKKNRTYDQVFGSFRDQTGKPRGNGDPNLTLFGEEVTPNHHELARRYVLLDNFFCDGEVSADGHPWSTAAYVTDITSRTWPVQYSGKGRSPLNEQVTVPPAGYLWDLCARKGVSYRSYGEYVYASGPDSPPEPLTSMDGVTGLKGHASAGWQAARAAGKRDFEKADVFIAELEAFERSGNLPRFMVMSLGEDHTTGTRAGTFTPRAAVAANDLALGKIVEACSRSRFWKEMAIFVVEDDAQNGPDHVDAHRTVALAVSPYSRRNHLDNTFYTTVSMVRTIELILGLPPLSQYDAAAAPMYESFSNQPDFSTYAALPARYNLNERNPPNAAGAEAIKGIDFGEYDLLTVEQEDALNRSIWHSVNGADRPYPPPVRGSLFTRTGRPALSSRVPARGDDDDR